jgi:hypothetical protein
MAIALPAYTLWFCRWLSGRTGSYDSVGHRPVTILLGRGFRLHNVYKWGIVGRKHFILHLNTTSLPRSKFDGRREPTGIGPGAADELIPLLVLAG